MSARQKLFVAVDEPLPGARWRAHYDLAVPGYRRWFALEGELKRPSLTECRDALATYLPEALSLWERLCALADADDRDARLLSFWCPAPYLAGCSQAVWTRYAPTLVRNYDYHPDFCEGRVLKSRWQGQSVIAATDCLWGVLDGMNESGLCVSLAFGGSDVVGEGFGIPVVLRAVLESCATVDEAARMLCRVPVHMACNLTLLDAWAQVRTVELAPFAAPVVSYRPLAVNHQGEFDLSGYAMFSRSHEREEFLRERLYDPLCSLEAFASAFEYAPLFAGNYAQGFGTLYTAIYYPALRAMEYRWPHRLRMPQSFAGFAEGEWWVLY